MRKIISGVFAMLIAVALLTAQTGTRIVNVGSSKVTSGTGSPEGAVKGNIGDLFIRTDGGAGTTLYTKESGTGNTGWAAVVGGGGGGADGNDLVLLEQHTASSSSELVFTTGITSTYDDYEFRFIGLRPATDGADLLARFSTNGGSSYDSSAIYARSHHYVASNNTSAFAGTTNSTSMDIGGDQDNASTGSLGGNLMLTNPLSTTQYKTMHGEIIYNHDSVGEIYIRRSVMYPSTSAVNAVQFFYDTGNIAEGTIRLYGRVK
jgi:hypothetical protein